MIKQYIADLRKEFAGYNSGKLMKDILAGLTVTAVALPLALAFGVGSGASASAGLITAVLAGVVTGLLSGASFQISGPTGAMTAVLILIVQQYGLQGVFAAGLMSGIILVAAGLLKLGRLVNFIPISVITGFTSGIALVIALGQVDNFFGVKSSGETVFQKVLSYFTNGFSPKLQTMIPALVVVAVMILWPKKWNLRFPSSLLGIIVVLILNLFFHFDAPTVGAIPKTLLSDTRLDFTALNLSSLGGLIPPAITIAALGMIESLLCGAAAGKMKGERLGADRELVAQGIGNILIPFFGGVPSTAAIARTSVAIKSGSVTRLTGIVHAVGILLSMFLLAPVMSSIPLSALAGVLMVTAWRMNDWENIEFIFKRRIYGGMAKFFVTMAATVLLDLTQAIILGVLFSSVLVIIKLTDLKVEVSEIDKERFTEAGDTECGHIRVAYITGALIFATTEKIRAALSSFEDTEIIIFSMRGVPAADLSGVQTFLELCIELKASGKTVLMCSLQPKIREEFERCGMFDVVEGEYWDAKAAMTELLVG